MMALVLMVLSCRDLRDQVYERFGERSEKKNGLASFFCHVPDVFMLFLSSPKGETSYLLV